MTKPRIELPVPDSWCKWGIGAFQCVFLGLAIPQEVEETWAHIDNQRFVGFVASDIDYYGGLHMVFDDELAAIEFKLKYL